MKVSYGQLDKILNVREYLLKKDQKLEKCTEFPSYQRVDFNFGPVRSVVGLVCSPKIRCHVLWINVYIELRYD